ncbi:transferrin receptor-like dimerization domain-containing protein [Chitinophaga ginsengisoli]|uniref:N-acetylated-alpha-linked acidic dipeptidase n=1 Tax=Chitinophaga ginsengisoli TaxID=363837 RepID=A0A2P8G1C9_9BACT|nr:transferrin receptor-like dimerization domain-containing protein [Chitinophaga ginsengisoli]PSL27685.1 N-acetylated-alpha-linked acidic dipeptidase [Chitinophaga ginsengisoli]
MNSKKITSGIALILLLQSTYAQQKLSGFSSEHSQQQQQLEANFDKELSAAAIGNNIKTLSAQQHYLGMPRDKWVAENILQQFKSYGWDARIETYQVLFPTPKTRVLEASYPENYKAVLKEPALKEDPSTGQPDELATYNAWSADGDVTGELVFVNYGLPEDYEYLERLGISVQGKIVVAKYGRSWRGIKPKVAQEHGAIGTLIYSDPKDDGYYQGDVYPQGPYKSEYGVQRGSIMDMVIYPGDPLTPGVGATENAKRLERSEATNLLKIPVLPISYHDAAPLLAALEGPVAPESWRGALPFTYHIGPGKAKVHLKLEFDWKMVPAYNVIAFMKGSQLPDQWVIRGNHHDAWVYGAADPVSGLSALLEEAKAIGVLAKKGYKPKRTLVYAAWDGEEPGLLGSTEWVEAHAAELQQKAVAYINSDGNSRGYLGIGGSHALEPFAGEVARGITDPQTKVNILERKQASDIVSAATTKAKKDLLGKKDMTISALGSGSDYSSFLQHLGIPSLNVGFGGEGAGGEYHSIYDTYENYSRFKDPGFEYGVALSKFGGHAALRLAEADVLPFDFRSLSKTINGYTTELISLAEQMRESTAVENQIINNNAYQLTADVTKPIKAPAVKSEVPYIDFSKLQNALVALDKATQQLQELRAKGPVPAEKADGLNKALYQAEQQLLYDKGLPNRGWYKHTVYAPGFYTGYGVKTLPGIREAIEQRRWQEAEEQIAIAAAAVNRLTNYLQQAAAGLGAIPAK